MNYGTDTINHVHDIVNDAIIISKKLRLLTNTLITTSL